MVVTVVVLIVDRPARADLGDVVARRLARH